jgi:hypothetical protein
MKFITEDAVIVCDHKLGKVVNLPSQAWVTIGHRRVLVESDPEMRVIVACPNIGATIKPCLLTLKVKAGYSTFIRIGGHHVCFDTVTGLTDGTPPGVVNYTVHSPGQEFVTGAA